VATDQVNRKVDPYASTSAMRIRLLIRPFDSYPVTRMPPTSLVFATCVPPSACRSSPTISIVRISSIPSGSRLTFVRMILSLIA
jgi:hypothetical protein